MKPIVTQETRRVEVSHPVLPAVECQTLTAFLRLARFTPVLLTTQERQVAPRKGSGAWEMQFAVHLTARSTESGNPICYATFLAAIVSGTHTKASLAFPYEGPPLQPDLTAEVKRLVEELHDCLSHVVRAQTTSLGVQPQSRYVLPDSFVWGVRSDPSTEGIRFQHGQWFVEPVPPSR